MKLSQARQEATVIAKLIVSSKINAYDGAMKIWKEVLEKLDDRIPDDLWPFKSNASAIEDCLWDAQGSGSNHDALIARFKNEIMGAARFLLRESDLKMKEYHKIQTVYLRDPATKHTTLLEGQFAKPEFEYLKNNTWVFTEKVDGTNIRVHWNGEHVVFAGKTDHADIPKFLLDKLAELFTVEVFSAYPLPPLCLYGEGYGAKIQKGGGTYIPEGVSFILFDVEIDGIWLERHNVEDIATKLAINSVPIVGKGTLLEGIERVRNGYDSRLRNTPPEGMVMRPEVELINRRGERVITKLNDYRLKPVGCLARKRALRLKPSKPKRMISVLSTT